MPLFGFGLCGNDQVLFDYMSYPQSGQCVIDGRKSITGATKNIRDTDTPLSRIARYSDKQRIRPNVAFFLRQIVADKHVLDDLGLNGHILLPQPSRDRLITQVGRLIFSPRIATASDGVGCRPLAFNA